MTQHQATTRPLQVLHVLRRMDVGGIENWLLAMLKLTKPEQMIWTFLVHAKEPGCHEAEIERLGGKILRITSPQNPLKYAKQLRRLLATNSFDVIHSHLHLFSGWVLRATYNLVPIRIAHAHNVITYSGGLFRNSYRFISQRWLSQYATVGLAASASAAANCFGSNWQQQNQRVVLPCGIDLSPFKQNIDRDKIRQELGITTKQCLIVNVGRFVLQKNHQLMLEIIQTAIKNGQQIHFCCIGDGPLRANIEQKIKEYGLQAHVSLLGARHDVPALLGAADRFLFPSFHEGLGLAAVEAQAAGLPVIMSDCIPDETTVVPALVQRISLSADITKWAEALKVPASISRVDALKQVTESPFSLTTSYTSLCALYCRANYGSR